MFKIAHIARLTSGPSTLVSRNITYRRGVLIAPNGQPREIFMADNSAGIGVMGVLVGALIVIVVGAGILFATGTIGGENQRQ